MGFKVVPQIKNDAEELARKKGKDTDYFSSTEISEDSRIKSDELIAMLEKQVGKKKKKEKMLKRDITGTLVPGSVASAKGLIKGAIVGAFIVAMVIVFILIFSGKQNLDIGKHFDTTVGARVYTEYGGNAHSTYQYKEYNINDLKGKARTKEKIRSMEFNLKPNGRVYVYNINFDVRTEGVGQFALVAVIKDGNNLLEVGYWTIVSKADKAFNVEIVLNYTFTNTDNGDCSIILYSQAIHDEFYANQSMDESIGGWTLYNLNFKK